MSEINLQSFFASPWNNLPSFAHNCMQFSQDKDISDALARERRELRYMRNNLKRTWLTVFLLFGQRGEINYSENYVSVGPLRFLRIDPDGPFSRYESPDLQCTWIDGLGKAHFAPNIDSKRALGKWLVSCQRLSNYSSF